MKFFREFNIQSTQVLAEIRAVEGTRPGYTAYILEVAAWLDSMSYPTAATIAAKMTLPEAKTELTNLTVEKVNGILDDIILHNLQVASDSVN